MFVMLALRRSFEYFSTVLGRKRGEPSGSHALASPHDDSVMLLDMLLPVWDMLSSHGTGSSESSHQRTRNSSIEGQRSGGQRLTAPQRGFCFAQKQRGTRPGVRLASLV